ncbi:hypothetical protein Y032_0045g1143 [Ancylostoma ceylanicum]|uniref:GIY-YIG domain-containing protein n=1 Tax=Ancylostoma ceylanicum TaxID=53326 RepID=A0A016UD86_9BILA|nr:hypothetical protein Y032_0045g1143 [Ancylostoma ceylanicum]
MMFWFLDDLFVNQCTWKTCCQRNTMYLVTCEGCGQKYIGETSRPLYKRLDEQVSLSYILSSASPACYQIHCITTLISWVNRVNSVFSQSSAGHKKPPHCNTKQQPLQISEVTSCFKMSPASAVVVCHSTAATC